MSHLYAFRVGKFKAYMFNDGTSNNKASSLFATAPPELLSEALARYKLQADVIPVYFNMAFPGPGRIARYSDSFLWIPQHISA